MVLLGLPAVTLWAPGAPALFGKSVGDSVGGRSCSAGERPGTSELEQLQKSEREKPHRGKTKSQSPTKTPCNQPASQLEPIVRARRGMPCS